MALDDPDTRIYGQYIRITQRFLTENSTFEKLLPLSPQAVVSNALTQKVGDFYRQVFLAIVKEANPLAYDAGTPPASKWSESSGRFEHVSGCERRFLIPESRLQDFEDKNVNWMCLCKIYKI